MHRERKPNRLHGYDYSTDNLYFVTSCVHDRICCFGKIVNGEMIQNENGKIADDQWHWLEKQYPYVVLYEFIVMPNHIHGIIEINRLRIPVGTDIVGRTDVPVGTVVPVGTGRDLSLQRERPSQRQRPSPRCAND